MIRYHQIYQGRTFVFVKLSEIRTLMKLAEQQALLLNADNHTKLLQQLALTPGNFYQELEMDSPYVDTHRDVSYSNAHVQIHSHVFFEILCCRNTCGAEYLLGAERYKLQKGDIVFVPPHVSHRPILPEHMPEPYHRDVLWINEDFWRTTAVSFPELSLEYFSKPGLFRTSGTKWSFLCDLFRKGVAETEAAEPGWEILVIANTLTILTHLRRSIDDPRSAPLKAEKPDLLDQVLAYMEQHLSEKLTLADVAKYFFVSESTITQTFRKKMGVSFYRCVTQRRLISSKLLIEQGIPLETVAERVGFSDYSSFFRAFKQEYGISPRQFRKLQTEQK